MDEYNSSLLCLYTISSASQCDTFVQKGISFRYLDAMYPVLSMLAFLIVALYAQNIYLHTWLTCFALNVTYSCVHANVFLSVMEDSEKTAIET